MPTWSSGRGFGSLVADDMAAFGGPGGVQPCTGGGWRVTRLCAVLPEGDQRRAIGHPQIKMRDEAGIDHLLDDNRRRIGDGAAIGHGGRGWRSWTPAPSAR